MAKKLGRIFSIFTKPQIDDNIIETTPEGIEDSVITPEKEVIISNFSLSEASATEFGEASLRNDIPEALLTTITEIINKTQPELIQKSLDVEAEKREIYNQIYPAFSEYIKHISARIVANNERELDQTKQEIGQIKKELEERLVSVKIREESYKERYLSSERQKRGLADRVADLEQRIETLNSEYAELNKNYEESLKNPKYSKAGAEESADLRPDPRVEELTTQLVEVTRNYQAVQRELIALKQKVESSTTEQQNEKLQQELKDSKYQYDLLKEELQGRAAAVVELEAKVSELELDRCKTIDDSTEENLQLEELIKQQREELSIQSKKLETLLFKESKVLEYKKELDAARKELIATNKEIERHKTQTELSRQNVLALTKEVEKLKAEMISTVVSIPDEIDDLLLIMKPEREEDIIAEQKRERMQRKREEQATEEIEKPKPYEDPAQMKLW